VTQLRQKMLEELQRRNYSHRTAKTYIRIVREFATYFHRPPDKLGPEQIRQYQAHLFQKKLSPATVSQYVSALRFSFIKTLNRHFLAEYIPFPKSRKRLPIVLRPARLISSARNLYHRTLHDLIFHRHAPCRTLADLLKIWRMECGYSQPSDSIFASAEMDGKQPLWPNSMMEDHIRPWVGIRFAIRSVLC